MVAPAWVARDAAVFTPPSTRRPASIGVGKSASRDGGRTTTDLPPNDAYNGGPVVPADYWDENYYSEASLQERKALLSAQYGHLRAADAKRAKETERGSDRSH